MASSRFRSTATRVPASWPTTQRDSEDSGNSHRAVERSLHPDARDPDAEDEAPRWPIRRRLGPLSGCCLAAALFAASADAAPPFSGTIFLDPDIVTAADPSSLVEVTPAGLGERTLFDRRADAFVTLEVFLFDATFDDGLAAEVQVNPEFGAQTAAEVALEYAAAAGRIPTALRTDVDALWIHRGVQPFGGGNRSLLIHTGQGELYVQDGILEETLIHEATHTSLDAAHAAAPGWLAAQAADPEFISEYAEQFPGREDLAESLLPWLAVRHRPERISEELRTTIEQTIPHRLAYLDGLQLDLHPIVGDPQVGAGPCVRDEHTACLLAERFEVTAELRDFSNPPDGPGALFPGTIQRYGDAGTGSDVSSETDQSVSFYAFEDGNVEVFVKVLDGCSFAGAEAFWVFAAGATNAETTIEVRDTWSDELYRIESPRGVDFFAPPDTQAFRTCDAPPP
ncbi:MAG: hypothetical protein DWQ36_22335 [Acidobacteria bacterium]|nr:MAG: hypothetical protein DWQ30_06655 [Acidobacteriota bacterium]REK00577.1 MAG: hypothetical protein DWQ36_22335 [Acidobacteriota bacterium]